MLTIKIKTDNDAFQHECREYEITNCLNDVSNKITNGFTIGIIHDTNGNKVGTYKLTNR